MLNSTKMILLKVYTVKLVRFVRRRKFQPVKEKKKRENIFWTEKYGKRSD